MGKKRLFSSLLVLLFGTTLLTGCYQQKGRLEVAVLKQEIVHETSGEKKPIFASLLERDTEVSEAVQDTESVESTEDLLRTQKAPIYDLGDAYELILNNCTKEFIGGHLVDESFLSWVQANYGEDAILDVANALQEEDQDPTIWYEVTGNSIHVLWLLYCQDAGFQTYSLDHVLWKETSSVDKTVFDFTGDINFAEDWYTTNYMDAQPGGIYDCISEDLLAEMNAADIMFVNNEFTYSTRGEPLEGKAYTFRADPNRVHLLETFGTDMVNLANNHVYDYGEDALLDTMDTLTEDGIPYVGAGRNIDEAMQPAYVVANGRKIAIVAATQIERSTNYTKEATETTPGVLKTLNAAKFVEVIKEAKENSDYVIAYVHWGTEGQTQFNSEQTSLAKQFVEAGADAIIGSHPHYLQGVSYVEGVPVFYSLGNFWFSTGTMNTGMAQVEIDSDGALKVRYLPCIQSGLTTSLVTDQATKDSMLSYMEGISKDVVLDQEGYIYNTADNDSLDIQELLQVGSTGNSGNYLDSAMDTVGNLKD